jgi:hypothetical protein
MKHIAFGLLSMLLLTACQTAPADETPEQRDARLRQSAIVQIESTCDTITEVRDELRAENVVLKPRAATALKEADTLCDAATLTMETGDIRAAATKLAVRLLILTQVERG